MHKHFLFLSILFSMTSCTLYNYTYVVTPQNTADVRKKGQLQVDTYIPLSRLNLQMAYAPTHHLGVMADYCYGFRGDVNSLDIGLGYYMSGAKNTFNIYAGAGMTSVNMNVQLGGYWEDWTINNYTQYDKLFVQSHIGRQISKKIRLSLTARLSYVYFNSYAYKDHQNIYKGKASIDSVQLTVPASAWLLQSAVTADVFPERRFSFRLQFGLIGTLYADEALNSYTVDIANYPRSTYSTGTEFAKQHQPVYFPVFINAGIRLNLNTKANRQE
jgi:hypothetical protein